MTFDLIKTRVLLIDNYDSFTYNIYQYMAELGAEIEVRRNDQITIQDCIEIAPDRIFISPGPGTPKEAGISCEIIKYFAGKLPISGVCLGLQCIYEVFGGTIGHANEVLHGKSSIIHHDGKGLFKNIPNPMKAIRYHSLVGIPETLPNKSLMITSFTTRTNSNSDNRSITIMGIRHMNYQIEAVQFHPESILSEYGKEIIYNFLTM